jgi:hypothetical protein
VIFWTPDDVAALWQRIYDAHREGDAVSRCTASASASAQVAQILEASGSRIPDHDYPWTAAMTDNIDAISEARRYIQAADALLAKYQAPTEDWTA